MAELIHLIYCSAAEKPFSKSELADLLDGARRHNAESGITGMLLYAEGSFFQVLEGEPAALESLYEYIDRDKRHQKITVIIREPIASRSFSDWTMGYADISPAELDEIVGTNDYLTQGDSFINIGPGRARKLMSAFKQGRWRSALGNNEPQVKADVYPELKPNTDFKFAYQPIIDAGTRTVFSYEALIRGPKGESAETVLKQLNPAGAHMFHEQSRVAALETAAQLGLSARINLNFLPSNLGFSPTAVTSILKAALDNHIRPEQIVLEILESDIIQNYGDFATAMNQYRASGLSFAIDDFGAGYAGLNLLAEFQPDFIKIDMHLVRGIENNGPRQAIIRGIARTCLDLGIDIVAEGVETVAEYHWFRNEGIELFQGYLFARPELEVLTSVFELPG